MFISEAFAQSADAAAGSPSIFGSLGGMLPIVLMFVVLFMPRGILGGLVRLVGRGE